MKKIIFSLLFFSSLFFVPTTLAQSNAFMSIVNPIRGDDFWDLKDQRPNVAVLGQIAILNKFNLPATWLLRFDALDAQNITQELKKRDQDEKGLFLEVTPSWANEAKVRYHKSNSWHSAGSAFLTGYERSEREKLIDAGFEKFKTSFGYYPLSVGAWWIDSYSLEYMQRKYGISGALIVSDQYSTDNYQIWGQYFSTPYYPAKSNALHPAQTEENKLNVVMMQWAPRDPINSYGNGVTDSTYSVQANDYITFHNLDTKYFSRLVDIYTKQTFNRFAHLVVGLENSYSWSMYSDEYQKQIEVLAKKANSNELSVIPMKDFANWYKSTFPKLSPAQVVMADDPLGSYKKAVWFMNPYFRAGWFVNSDGSVFRDIRQYIDGEEELCFRQRCDSVNFATSATRVLDDVSFGQKWVIDEGKINDFRLEKKGEIVLITYRNEAGNIRKIGLLPRDISVNDKVFSIDSAILNVTIEGQKSTKINAVAEGFLQWSIPSIALKVSLFLTFLIIAITVPGLVLSNKLFAGKTSLLLKIFISQTMGFATLALLFYITSLMQVKPLIFVYISLCLFAFIRFRLYSSLRFKLPKINSLLNLVLITLILAGTVFQAIPTFRSGLSFTYGMGFWGPNTHDGVWHMALINELIKSVPAENPVYSGAILRNYHLFYDILIAATKYLSGLPISDLVFRFYPIIFSLMLGVGSYYLAIKLFGGTIKAKVATIFSLYLIFFAGSFGWIVEYLREKHFGGESAFWANQAVSFNLNPPFAISLIMMIALLHILLSPPFKEKGKIITIVLLGTLISFKSYTGILVLGSFLAVAIVTIFRHKDFSCLGTFLLSLVLAVWLFLSNFEVSRGLVVFAPFWLIHSMIDSPDRVGWVRLSLARTNSQTLNEWPKFILAEILSLVIFIVGNLGLRILSLGLLVKIKEVFKNDGVLFIVILTLASILIPIFLIQSGNPWNTIQFFYPALYLNALFAGAVISFLIFKLNKVLATALIIIVVLLAPINSIVTASGYLSNTPHALISSKELEGLKFLSSQPDGIILTYPYDEKLKQRLSEPWPILAYDSTAYVSAISQKAVFLEDEPQNQILLTDYKNRLVASKDFFVNPNLTGAKFLYDNKIKYIYIPKIFDARLDESAKGIKNIFENEEVVIYRVRQD